LRDLPVRALGEAVVLTDAGIDRVREDAADRAGAPLTGARRAYAVGVQPALDRADRVAIHEPPEHLSDDRRLLLDDPDPAWLRPVGCVVEGERSRRHEPGARLLPPTARRCGRVRRAK